MKRIATILLILFLFYSMGHSLNNVLPTGKPNPFLIMVGFSSLAAFVTYFYITKPTKQ